MRGSRGETDTPPPEARRRARLRSAVGREGAIRAMEAFIGAFIFLLIVQNLLGFDITDARFWGRFQRSLFQGFVGTLFFTAIVIPLSLAIGFVAGWARVSRYRFLSWPVSVYVDLIRGVPPIILVIFAFLFGPELLPRRYQTQDAGLIFGAIALALHSGAYQTEIFRAGFQSVPRGQLEAAHAIGLTRWQTMSRVALPQAFRLSLPPLANEFSVLVKDTSLLGALGAEEMFALGGEFTQDIVLGAGPLSWLFAVWTAVALLYFLLNFAITRAVLFVERSFRTPGMEEVGM